MALEFKYNSKEVPGEHAALYVERDGAFVLDADGIVDAEEVEKKIASLEGERDIAKQERETLQRGCRYSSPPRNWDPTGRTQMAPSLRRGLQD